MPKSREQYKEFCVLRPDATPVHISPDVPYRPLAPCVRADFVSCPVMCFVPVCHRPGSDPRSGRACRSSQLPFSRLQPGAVPQPSSGDFDLDVLEEDSYFVTSVALSLYRLLEWRSGLCVGGRWTPEVAAALRPRQPSASGGAGGPGGQG